MARMKFGREFDWMDYRVRTTFENGKVWLHLEATPKRWYALRPSFWLFAIRHLRLRVRRSQDIEE